MASRVCAAAVLLCSAMTAGQAMGQAAGSDPMAPVNQFLNGFNKGDTAAMTAALEADSVIMDEVPPHIWRGNGAMKAWMASLDAYDKAHGRTDGAVSLGKPQVLTADGDRGYAVVPAVYTFKEKGVPTRETATMTYILHKTGSVWKLQGWAWNGTVPVKAGK